MASLIVSLIRTRSAGLNLIVREPRLGPTLGPDLGGLSEPPWVNSAPEFSAEQNPKEWAGGT